MTTIVWAVATVDTALRTQTHIANTITLLCYSIPRVAQYEYEDFDEVLEWIQPSRFDEESLKRVKSFNDLRAYYQQKGNSQGVRSVENLLKKSVGIRRMAEDVPDFRKKYFGLVAKFKAGDFWDGANLEINTTGRCGVLSVTKLDWSKREIHLSYIS